MDTEAYSLVLDVMDKYSRGELKNQKALAHGKKTAHYLLQHYKSVYTIISF